MLATTLTTKMHMTAMVGVSLPTPADRIGQGKVAGLTHNPADSLSRGRHSSPRYPVPGSLPEARLESANQVEPPAVASECPAGSRPCGSTASRRELSRVNAAALAPFTAGRLTTPMAALPGAATRFPVAEIGAKSRVFSRETSDVRDRVGRDCQSPDRVVVKRVSQSWRPKAATTWETTPATAAGK